MIKSYLKRTSSLVASMPTLSLEFVFLMCKASNKPQTDTTVGEMADAGKQVEMGDAVGGMAEILDM